MTAILWLKKKWKTYPRADNFGDMIRLAEEMDGTVNGPIYRHIIKPAIEGISLDEVGKGNSVLKRAVIGGQWKLDEIEALVNKLTGITFRDESDIATVILTSMTFMSTFKTLPGLSKKIIVIEALKKIVELSKLDNKESLLVLITIIDKLNYEMFINNYLTISQKC